VIPGEEFQMVTQAAFDQVWEPLGWVIADPEDQPDTVYSIPSTEKGAPFGVATLNEDGLVEQGYVGGSGGLNVDAVNELIDTKIALITAETHGWIPQTTPVVLFVDNTLQFTQRTTHPGTVAGKSQEYALNDGTHWVQVPSGFRTQVAPGFVSPSVELALEKTINSLTLSTVFTVNLAPDAAYSLELVFSYESTVAASGERLRIAFDPPPGTTGFYGVSSMNSAGASSGTLAPNWVAKQWDETFDIGGSGAAAPRYCVVRGNVYTGSHEPAPDAEAAFDFRARLTTLDGAGVPLVPAKIYGANTVDYDAARMTLDRLN
jgi:hypothetical protein